MRFRFWYLEAYLVVMFIVGTFLLSSNPSPKNPDFIPSAVNGLATMSGILTALIGYLITYILPRIPDTPKLWIARRVVVVLFSIAVGLSSMIIGFSEFIFGSVEASYKYALFGTSLLILTFFEGVFMVIFIELERATNLSDTF